MLPTLSPLSVRYTPGDRFRHWCSSRYLRISPLHREFRLPLMPSSSEVSPDPSRLSREISQETFRATYRPFTPSNSGQRLPPTYYRGCWHVVSRDLFLWYRPCSSQRKEVYDPRAFVPHAASLHQAFAHCARSPAAASRRSGGRVSVPLWPIVLSHRLPVEGLVGRYPANYLIGRESLLEQQQLPVAFPHRRLHQWANAVLIPVSRGYPPLEGRSLTRYSAVRRCPDNLAEIGTARLACIRRAASVRPEPGSNSPKLAFLPSTIQLLRCKPPRSRRGETSVYAGRRTGVKIDS